MNSSFQEMKKAHALLMSNYVDVLNQALYLPFFIPSQFRASYLEVIWPNKRNIWRGKGNTQVNESNTRFASLFSLRYLVQLFVELHIRARLLELSIAYSYLAQKHLEDEQVVTWLREISEDCAKLAETLTSWQSLRAIVSIAWPFILSVATAALGLETIYDIFEKVHLEARDLTLLGLIMVFPLTYLAIFISFAFESKRELFMPGFDRTEEPLESSQAAEVTNVIYILEDQVFRLAGRRKPRETPLDVIGMATGCFVIVSIPVLIWIHQPSSSINSFLWLIGLWFGLLGIGTILYGRKRKWR